MRRRRIGGDHTAGAKCGKEKAAEAASGKLKSPVALPPSIEVPRTMAIGLTDATLDCPVRRATVPGSATVIVIVAVMTMADVNIQC